MVVVFVWYNKTDITFSISVGTWRDVAVSEPAAAKDSNKEQETATRR